MAYPLTVTLQPSPGLLAPVLAAHAAVGLALFHVGLDVSMLGVFALLVLASALAAIAGERRKHAVALVLHEDGGATLLRDGVAPCVTRVRPGAVIFPGVIWFQLELLEAGQSRRRRLRLMLVAGNLPPGQWRSTKVWLRHRALRLAAVSA
ncbi:MAG: hypothetical protein Q7J47_07255 [Azoarcus sp.]|nr:hypothetical protein [Azoarcus sp.]